MFQKATTFFMRQSQASCMVDLHGAIRVVRVASSGCVRQLKGKVAPCK